MCIGRRTFPKRGIPTKKAPMLGEKGMLLLRYIGDEPATWFGDVTNAAYDFVASATRFVDVRDAAFFLGPEFVEVS